MTKKILTFLLALACVTFFAACGSDDTANSSSTGSEASAEASSVAESSEAVSDEAVSSEEASSAVSKEESADAASEASVYHADGFSFTIPDGFELASEKDNSVTFVNADFKILGIEIQPNTEGITTITQEDIEKDFAEGVTDTSASVEMNFELLSFKSLQVDGKEAAIVYCVAESEGVELPITAAEIINGDSLIMVVLMSGEDDTAFVEEFLSTMKID